MNADNSNAIAVRYVEGLSDEELKVLCSSVEGEDSEDFQVLTAGIAIVGHVDHGKSTTAAAVSKFNREIRMAMMEKAAGKGFISKERLEEEKLFYSKNNNSSVGDFDKTEEERTRGVTIRSTTVPYRPVCLSKDDSGGDRVVYGNIVDCPGHRDYVANMVTGSSNVDFAIIVIAATDGVLDQTKEHVNLLAAMQVKYVIVYINKMDTFDESTIEMVDLVEEDIKSLLESRGIANIDVVRGSSLKALEGEEQYLDRLLDLMKLIANAKINRVDRGYSTLSVEGVNVITGRGAVVVGKVVGHFSVGDQVLVIKKDKAIKSTITSMESHRRPRKRVHSGDNVGILLKGGPELDKEFLAKSIVRSVPSDGKPLMAVASFESMIYIIPPEYGGRTTPIDKGYEPQLLVGTLSVPCKVTAIWNMDGAGGKGEEIDRIAAAEGAAAEEAAYLVKFSIRVPMDKPDAKGRVVLKFDNPLIVGVGDTFAIRESNRTVARGKISDIKQEDYVSVKVS